MSRRPEGTHRTGAYPRRPCRVWGARLRAVWPGPLIGTGLILLLGCAPQEPLALEALGSFAGDPQAAIRAAAVEDLDGDGLPDLLLGLRDQELRGSAHLHRGLSGGGFEAAPAWSFGGPEAGGLAGFLVGMAGDLNGDGHPEVFVTATRLEGRGGVWVFRGGPGGPEKRPWTLLRGHSRQEDFGEAVAALGDLRGNGGQALAVSAFGHDRQRGKVYVYESRARQRPLLTWRAEGEAQGDWFGYSLSAPGDLDGDGHADLLVSAKNCDGACLRWLAEDERFAHHQTYFRDPPALPTPSPDTPSKQAGKLYLYRGGPMGLETAPAQTLEGEEPHELLGFALAAMPGAGPQGRPAVAASSTGWRMGRGRVTLFNLGAKGFEPRWQAPAPEGIGPHRWGHSLLAPGDLDGDGHGELVVVNPTDAELHVFHGRPDGFHPKPLVLKVAPPAGMAVGDLRRLLAVGVLPPAPDRPQPGLWALIQSRPPRSNFPASVIRFFGRPPGR